jgi:uncharacterized membrane protein
MPKTARYNSTAKGLMMWAEGELEHVGRIAGIKDKDIQYSYALSTVNGMAHLKDALAECAAQNGHHKEDLLKTHDSVIRVMKQLVENYKVNLNTIRQFNTRHVLSNLSYLTKKNTTRKNTK